MEKTQHLKAFIASASEYNRFKSEKFGSVVQRQLQILGVYTDYSIFDPDSSTAVEFYISLHELMSGLDCRSSLMWAAVTVLQQACHNSAARLALIQTYKFTPILTRILGTDLTHDKRIRLLQVLQELTYGIKISWQEAHLPFLISTLTQWIMTNEKEVVALSLGILVNLCYKNLPAIYTLMRCVDNKQFMRTVLNLQNESVNTQVQVCKLLIILEHLSGDIPPSDIINLIEATFATLKEAFKAKDIFLLHHIVDFFSDVRSNSQSCEVLRTYKRYYEDIESLLVLFDDQPDAERAGLLLEFLQQLVSLEVPSIIPLYPRLVKVNVPWIQTALACTQSLGLLRSIIVDVKKGTLNNTIKESVSVLLEEQLPVFLTMLDLGKGEDACPMNGETRSRITALLQLLREMCCIKNLSDKILSFINQTVVQKLCQGLILFDIKENSNLFQKDLIALNIYTLSFVAELAKHNGYWVNFFMELLSHQQILMVLAIGLYKGEENIKKEVLSLTGSLGFPVESFSPLAKSLCDLEPLVALPTGKSRTIVSQTGCDSQHELTPLFNITQEGRLDEFIAKLQQTLHNSEAKDIPMSSVMELYEYKLAAFGHSERALHASLEAVNNHATHLQHRLAQMNAEANRMHQLLYHSQQCVERLQRDKREISRLLESEKSTASQAHKSHVQDMKNKQKVINELNLVNEELRRNVLSLNEEKQSLEIKLKESQNQLATISAQASQYLGKIRSLEAKLKDQQAKLTDLTAEHTKLEGKLRKTEYLCQERETEIGQLKVANASLKDEASNLDVLVKSHERSLEEKDQEICNIQHQLRELQRIREMIYEISAGKTKEK
ncbi:hypothetical protein R5R35_013537 [Gryllus longicercus]|uniref:CIP2A N-terminal domain-containing protein n=1 Tax=Gryllus longicercus TaxID=2509291 RepID=A0AAN9VHM7_9ORTH